MNEYKDNVGAAYKKVEQPLRHLTVIAERAREAIVVVDLNGTIRFVNAAWAAMHGYESRQELTGKHISIFHTKEQMKTDVIPFIDEVKHRGQLAGPVDHVRRNGTPFPTEMLMVVVKDQAGKAMGLIGFATDITEQEHTKDELKRYRNRLVELVKQQTDELKATNEQLQRKIAQHEQAERDLKQKTAEIATANEQLQDQISEHERAKNELQEHRDQLEQRLREQSDELAAANEHLQHEIAERKQVEEHLKQQTDELKATSERLLDLINQVHARGHISEADVCKAIGSPEATSSPTNNRRAILEKVFRENIRLQKPELNDTVFD